MRDQGLDEAIRVAGGIGALARKIGISQPSVSNWSRVPAERAAYVGDIYAIDVVGARAAGLAPILIDSAGAYPDVDCPRIERLSDLLDQLPRSA